MNKGIEIGQIVQAKYGDAFLHTIRRIGQEPVPPRQNPADIVYTNTLRTARVPEDDITRALDARQSPTTVFDATPANGNNHNGNGNGNGHTNNEAALVYTVPLKPGMTAGYRNGNGSGITILKTTTRQEPVRLRLDLPPKKHKKKRGRGSSSSWLSPTADTFNKRNRSINTSIFSGFMGKTYFENGQAMRSDKKPPLPSKNEILRRQKKKKEIIVVAFKDKKKKRSKGKIQEEMENRSISSGALNTKRYRR